jgi:hypothetical protein
MDMYSYHEGEEIGFEGAKPLQATRNKQPRYIRLAPGF